MKNEKQLRRVILGINYYCEKIFKNLSAAKERQKLYKKTGFFARIVKLQADSKRVYGVFVR